MKLRRIARPRDERGATAVLVGLLSTVLFACAALAVDISSLAMERQRLHDHIDSAAHAAAFELPGNGAGAANAARNIATAQDPAIDPTVELFCVVASTGSPPTPVTSQIPSTCYPGPPPYTPTNYGGMACNDAICAIPCPTTGVNIKCNTVEVSEDKTVDYGFAPIIGVDEGNTGSVASAACKGSCGAEAPNPMDVVFMADRTRSMLATDREQMKDAILETLKTMTPSLHYVAFGTLHKTASSTGWGCATTASSSDVASSGKWVPISYSKTYLTGAATPTLNTADPLVKGVDCLPESPKHGTHLAAAFKGAAAYLLNTSTTSLGARPGAPKKVLVFETDGMPDESMGGPYQGLGDADDFGAGYNGSCKNVSGDDYYSSSYSTVSLRYWCKSYEYDTTSGNGEKGCDNLVNMAAEAKAEGVTVITVGFGLAATGGCTVTRKHNKNDPSVPWQTAGTPVKEALAEAASKHPETGLASDAGDCTTNAGRDAENSDGDFFFCATTGSELAPIFKTAISQVSTGIKLIRLP